ncbi:HYDIN isoform 22, partial [Pongo abelii]
NSGHVQLEFSWVSEDTSKAVSFAKPDHQGFPTCHLESKVRSW